jgi:transcriptional regulator with XRE-family HTH domain
VWCSATDGHPAPRLGHSTPKKGRQPKPTPSQVADGTVPNGPRRLAWGVRDLAGAAHVSADTVARFERGEALRRSTVRAIRTALEDAGCEFIREDDVSGPSMRMRKRPVKASRWN